MTILSGAEMPFGEQCFAAVGAEVDLRGPGYDDATHRYEIAITGGADGRLVGEANPGPQLSLWREVE